MQILKNLYGFFWLNPTTNNCNTYLIKGRKNILIDPGHYHLFGHVKDNLERLSLSTADIDMVITLHGHPDHLEGVRIFSRLPTIVALPRLEMEFIKKDAPHYWESMGLGNFEPQVFLTEGDFQIGDTVFDVIHTPGHSPGSICLYWRDKKVLFTSDLVFNQGIGRTDLPGGNSEELKKSIDLVSKLQTDYLLPGHGDMIAGPDMIKANFKEIETVWFAYL
ncbi:MAG: MBL fold metallo-hydrolase [Deltaproteobacteria bacterium]|nr:MBL fold metallo-hydrolase [Deltaproteobacteria bacterium]